MNLTQFNCFILHNTSADPDLLTMNMSMKEKLLESNNLTKTSENHLFPN